MQYVCDIIAIMGRVIAEAVMLVIYYCDKTAIDGLDYAEAKYIQFSF